MSQKGVMVSKWLANILLNWLNSYQPIKSMGVWDIFSETERFDLAKPSDLVVEYVLFTQQPFLTLFIAFPNVITPSFFLPHFSSLPQFHKLSSANPSCVSCSFQFKCFWLWTQRKSSLRKHIRDRQWRVLIVLLFTFSLALFLPVYLPQDSFSSSNPLKQLQIAFATHVSLSFPLGYNASGWGWAKLSSESASVLVGLSLCSRCMWNRSWRSASFSGRHKINFNSVSQSSWWSFW